MRKKKIEMLEKRIADLENSNNRLSEVVEFLSHHDRNDVVIDSVFHRYHIVYAIKYLYANKIHCVITDIAPTVWNSGLEIIDCTYDTVTFEHDNLYYLLKKDDETFTKIHKPAFVLEKELVEKSPKGGIAYTDIKTTAKKSVDSKKKA